MRDGRSRPALEALGAEVEETDRLDVPSLLRALAGAERVFHLAGGGKVSAMSADGLATLRAANVTPVEAVLHAARTVGVQRVVHFSSISAMGVQFDVRLDEDSPCRPATPHEIVKLEAERLSLEAWQRDKVPVVVLRPSQIYGPGDRRSEIRTLVRLARRGLVPLFGGGEGLVPWVFVSDVVDAALEAAERPAAIGRTYIISDAEPYRFADVVKTIATALGRRRGGIAIPLTVARLAISALEKGASILGRDPLFTEHRLASLCGKRILSIHRAQAELGFVPRVGLTEGMGRTIRWYTEAGLA